MMQAWADYLQGLKVNQERRPAVAPRQSGEPSNDSAYDTKQPVRVRR